MALNFPQAFKYPFNRPKALWNILWVLVPIYGWFLLFGYKVRIIGEFVQGKFKELPASSPNADFVLGFKMFFKALPGVLVIIASSIVFSLLGEGNATLSGLMAFSWVVLLLLIVPVLAINFLKKQTVASLFEFDLVRVVFKNPMDYFLTLLKDFVLQMVFLIMFLILVGIPAQAFTKNIFIADFYRRQVK